MSAETTSSPDSNITPQEHVDLDAMDLVERENVHSRGTGLTSAEIVSSLFGEKPAIISSLPEVSMLDFINQRIEDERLTNPDLTADQISWLSRAAAIEYQDMYPTDASLSTEGDSF